MTAFDFTAYLEELQRIAEDLKAAQALPESPVRNRLMEQLEVQRLWLKIRLNSCY
jgi:hypothetical protein